MFTVQANWPFGLDGIPNDHIVSDATWGGKTFISHVEFLDFQKESECGGRQRIFGIHRNATDYIPAVQTNSITFDNVRPDAVAYFPTKKQEWIGAGICGEFPCTAPENIIISFKDLNRKNV